MDKARSFRWSEKVKEIKDLIDSNCPMIYSGNWKRENGRGWRWALNLDINDSDAKRTIKEYQARHGVLNVTMGHVFLDDSPLPSAGGNQFGLYVRDVEDLVNAIQKDLDDPATIERWLNGDK